MTDSTKGKLYLAVIILLVGFVAIAGWYMLNNFDTPRVGSVERASEYHASSTAQMTPALVKTTRTQHLLRSGQTTLGSIVVVSTTAHSLTLRHSSSTLAEASTTIAILPGFLPQGTYTFDVALGNVKGVSDGRDVDAGLVLDFEAGFAGDYIVTYRGD